jgi:hypothetical protein
VTVDSQVCGHVPHHAHTFWWQSGGYMLEDDVIKFVHHDTQLLFIGKLIHEVWVIDHLKLLIVGVDANSGCWDSIRWAFVDAP